MSAGRSVPARWLAAALVAAAATACTGRSDSEQAEAPSGPAYFVQIASAGEPLAPPQDLEGVTIDIAPGVEYHLEIRSSTAGTSKQLATINGHPLVLADDYVRIGPSEFGPLQKGDRVSFTSEGAFINGELVGQLPPKPSRSQD